MSRKQHNQKSVLDEVIDLKFKETEKTPEKIKEFMDELIEEVLSLIDDDLDGSSTAEKDDSVPDGFSTRIEKDGIPDNMIPFVVLKKETTFLDYKCPKCQKENKLTIKKFDRSPFKEVTCPDCSHEFLVKLVFDSTIKSFVEVKHE